jgi:hypothetical protein
VFASCPLCTIAALEAELACGHRKIDMDDSYGGCVFCGFRTGYEEYEKENEKLEARLAEANQSVLAMHQDCSDLTVDRDRLSAIVAGMPKEKREEEMKTLTPAELLDLPMYENDAEAATIRGYLKAILLSVWLEGEEFNGKRPFGNSGWKGDVEVALIKAGVIEGSLDENGYIDSSDSSGANKLIATAIKELK